MHDLSSQGQMMQAPENLYACIRNGSELCELPTGLMPTKPSNEDAIVFRNHVLCLHVYNTEVLHRNKTHLQFNRCANMLFFSFGVCFEVERRETLES